jgi:hypothetical protein
MVLDGCWRRPTRRWIDLGTDRADYRPPALASFGEAMIKARKEWCKRDCSITEV